MNLLDLSRISYLKPSVAAILIWVQFGLSFLFLYFDMVPTTINGELILNPLLIFQTALSYGMTVYINLTFLRMLQTQFEYRKADIWVVLMLLASIWSILPVFMNLLESVSVETFIALNSIPSLLNIVLMIVVMRLKANLYGMKWQLTISTILMYSLPLCWIVLNFMQLIDLNWILRNNFIGYSLEFVSNLFLFLVFQRAHKSWDHGDLGTPDQLISQIGDDEETPEQSSPL